MWVNIDFSLDIADIINYFKELDYQGPIYLSFNTLKKASQVLLHLPSILNAFAENDLPVLEGPHFVDEGCIIDGELKTFDELYFATQGEKIVWYIKNYPISSDISTIILMSADLGINPMIVKMKDKEKKYQYYFVQESPLPEDVAKIISQSNYRLQRIKE